MKNEPACISRGSVDRHFKGTLDPEAERTMRAHLPECADCRGYYERQLVLAQLDPEALGPRDRIGRGLGISRKRPFVAMLVVASAAAAGLLLMSRVASENPEFHPRGGPARPASQIVVYRSAHGETPVVAGDSMAKDDELAFSYEDGAGKPRLMIFAVDEHRHVYWYYPAWTNPAEDPVSLAIEAKPGSHLLKEAIAQKLDGTRLEIHGVFTDAPFSVKVVESMIEKAPSGPLHLPIADAVDDIVVIDVRP